MKADLCRGLIVCHKEIPLWDLRAFGKIREKLELGRLRIPRQRKLLFDEKRSVASPFSLNVCGSSGAHTHQNAFIDQLSTSTTDSNFCSLKSPTSYEVELCDPTSWPRQRAMAHEKIPAKKKALHNLTVHTLGLP